LSFDFIIRRVNLKINRYSSSFDPRRRKNRVVDALVYRNIEPFVASTLKKRVVSRSLKPTKSATKTREADVFL